MAVDPQRDTERQCCYVLTKHMKYISLLLLAIQNTTVIIAMRYTRSRPVQVMFISSTCVVMQETMKFITSILVVFIIEGHGSVMQFCSHIYATILSQPLDCVKISVPSLLYVAQNNLIYVAISNLDAATFQVSYQLKILTTAIFSVILLQKELSRAQWFSLILLCAGVGIVQLDVIKTENDMSTSSAAKTQTQNAYFGLIAVVTACCLSGFAGVYFEKVLKSTKQSLWIRNIQMSSIGVVIGTLAVCVNDYEKVRAGGFFQGYDYWVWITASLNCFGGLLVAVVVKFADNILKGFATSIGIILSCVLSLYLFSFNLTGQFSLGAVLVIIAVYFYSRFVPVPVPTEDQTHDQVQRT